MSDEQSPTASGRHQRSAKNYLLDRNFQLKYTSFLVGITLAISVGLGVMLWSTSSKVLEQSQHAVEQSQQAVTQGRETVRQGQETIDRGKQVIVQSRRVSQVVAMNIAKEYAGDPELAKTFGESAQRDEVKLKEEQDRLERDAAFLGTRAKELEQQAKDVEVQAQALASQQRTMLFGIVVLLGLLVAFVGVAGIVFTHKVAGPIHKMKRLIRQVGEGKLVVREKLRKGDELQHFFEAFEAMVEDLRGRQRAEIAKVDSILARLSDAPVSQRGLKEFDENGVEMLRQLRREMQDQLDA
jgi:nitrogen fixation/metabolism regulation signal transduction histidine kinase